MDPGVLRPCHARVGVCPYAAQGGFHVKTDDPELAYEAYHNQVIPGANPIRGVQVMNPSSFDASINPNWRSDLTGRPSLSKQTVYARQMATHALRGALFGRSGRAASHGRLGRSRGVSGLLRRSLSRGARSLMSIPMRSVRTAWNSLGRIPGGRPLAALGAFAMLGNVMFLL